MCRHPDRLFGPMGPSSSSWAQEDSDPRTRRSRPVQPFLPADPGEIPGNNACRIAWYCAAVGVWVFCDSDAGWSGEPGALVVLSICVAAWGLAARPERAAWRLCALCPV